MTKGTPHISHYLPILLVTLIWGSMGIISTCALEEFSPIAVLCLRSGVGALILFPFARLHGGAVIPAKEDRVLLAILAVVGVVLCNYLYFYALQHTLLTNVAIIYAFGPIITALLAAIFLKEAIRQSRTIGMLLAFAGVVILLTDGHPTQGVLISFDKGNFAELLSAACLAVYTILSKRVKNTPIECVVFWLMTISFFITLPMAYLLDGGINLRASPKAWLAILYLGVLCSGFGYLLQQKSIKTIGAASSSAFLNGISPITILSAAIFLKEPVTAAQIVCMLVIFAGVFLNAANKTLLWRRKNGTL
ncbi:MAG: DMT family transporter [Oscillospiraceae bacterium]|nr:DMT family transporter [Oscillospiraceae bacterium]